LECCRSHRDRAALLDGTSGIGIITVSCSGAAPEEFRVLQPSSALLAGIGPEIAAAPAPIAPGSGIPSRLPAAGPERNFLSGNTFPPEPRAMAVDPIQTPGAPAPAGHYSQAIVHRGIVYVSGQLPVFADRRAAPAGSVEEQTERTLHNVAAILEAAGSGLDHVLQMTIYISDMELWTAVNDVYARIMGDHRPARAVVPTREFRNGYQIEIQAIAAVRQR
jgi:2-iminobutanoate/2-iminopropanoate deaminase